jgi:hypothetical protein
MTTTPRNMRNIDNMPLSEMTPEERKAAIAKARAQFQAELTRNADKIAAVLRDFDEESG